MMKLLPLKNHKDQEKYIDQTAKQMMLDDMPSRKTGDCMDQQPINSAMSAP